MLLRKQNPDGAHSAVPELWQQDKILGESGNAQQDVRDMGLHLGKDGLLWLYGTRFCSKNPGWLKDQHGRSNRF